MNTLTNYTTEKIFTRLLTNKSKKNYWNYVGELRKRETDEIFKRSVLLTKSDFAKERIIGIDILSQFGFPRLYKKEILTLFFDLLKHETNKNVITSILYGVGHNNEKLTNKQVELLCSFQNHKSVSVKRSLISSLLSVEKDNAIDTLIKLSNDKDSDIRDWSTFGIGSQIETDNEKIRTALWNRISDKDEETKYEAITGLAQRKDERIKEVLKKELKNIDGNCSLILDSIELLNAKEFIPLLEKKVIENKKSKKVNEDWLLDTINKLNEK